MKQITAIAVCLLASLAAAGTASAQDHAAKATVPFGFNVGSTYLPAGDYTMTSDAGNRGAIAILNADKKVVLLSLVRDADPAPGAHTLVFKKIGGQYFLHEIECSSCRMNVDFNTSKKEKQAQTREASAGTATDIYLALK